MKTYYITINNKLYPLHPVAKDSFTFKYKGVDMYYNKLTDGPKISYEVAKQKFPEYFV